MLFIIRGGTLMPINLARVTSLLAVLLLALLVSRAFVNAAGATLHSIPSLAASPADLVKDINSLVSPTSYSSPREFATIGTITYFTASDTANGAELWKS